MTYNEEGHLGLPPRHEEIWGDAHLATKRTLTQYAKKTLAEMFVEGMPLSQTLKKRLGTQYASSEEESEEELEEESEEEWEAEEMVEMGVAGEGSMA